MSMKNYQKVVASAASRMQGEAVYNGSLDHAAILIAQIFKSANSTVDILSGTLDARVFGTGEVVDAARQFLGRTGNKIRIALERPDMVDLIDHPLINAISKSDDVQFKKISAEISSELKFHLTVADAKIYRFEEDKNLPSAVAAFGNESVGKHLQSVFEHVWISSTNHDMENTAGSTA